ncbi:MAG: hypothetical protein NC118_04300 [Eubacterium sp.]|nr:hypothetical protein [Eubacterium sp.]
MERDFELEYREMKQNETPDLWSRIEAGLSDKKIATTPLEEPVTVRPERFVVRKQTPWKRWGLLAAACLGVVILFPAVIRGITGSYKNSSSSADTSLADEGNMSGSMSASMTEAAEASEPVEESASAAAEEPVEESASAAAEEPVGEADAGASEAPEEAASTLPELTDGQILEGAVVQILQVDEAGEETVYHAVVTEADADAVMEDGMQVELICNDKTQYDFVREPGEEKGLAKEENYEVSLQYEQDRLVVLTAAKK